MVFASGTSDQGIRLILRINVRSYSRRHVRRKARNKTVNIDAMPKLNRAIKLTSLIAPFTRLQNNGKPTTSQVCNQSAGERLKNKLA